jgi:hypothetical protein
MLTPFSPRCSLPRSGPRVIDALHAMSTAVIMQSIVRLLPVDGFTYVPSEWGVMSGACGDWRRAL